MVLSEAYCEALDELRQLQREFRSAAEEPHYGFFIGGDPRNFSPDPECSTDEERAYHKRCCDMVSAGLKVEIGLPQCTRGDGSLGFGLGTTVLEDPVAADAAERLERIIDRLEREWS